MTGTARAAVVGRAAGLDQEGVVEEAPPELGDHIEQLRNYLPAAELFNQGWCVALVDISRVRAAQPIVHVDHAEARTEPASAADVASIAAITIPIQTPAELPGGLDAAQKAWVLTSANPNLRITGAWSGQVNGQAGLGFHVALLPSFVRVASFKGRFILVDGHHRAFGLLQRGIARIPALVGDVPTFEALGLPQTGMLSQDAYLGERPALMRDYLDEMVAANVRVPATQKIIAITALEFQASKLKADRRDPARGQPGSDRERDRLLCLFAPRSALTKARSVRGIMWITNPSRCPPTVTPVNSR